MEKCGTPAGWTRLTMSVALSEAQQACVVFPTTLLIAWVKEQGQSRPPISPVSLEALQERQMAGFQFQELEAGSLLTTAN